MIKKHSSKVVIMLLAIVAISTFSGCKKDSDKVLIGYSRLRISLPIFVAESKGFFKKNGVNVELSMFDTAQPLMDALLAGHLDIAGYTAFPISFNGQLRSKKELYYTTMIVEDDAHPISMLMVKKDSPLKTIKDLRGKRIGILPTFAYKAWIELILNKNGIPLNEVVIQQISPALTPSSLESGNVDAMFINDPAITTTIQKGIGRLLTTEALVPKYMWSPFPFGSFNINKEYAVKNPETVRKIVKALDEAIDFINSNPAEAKKIMGEFLSESEKPFIQYYSDSKYYRSDEVSQKDLNRLMDEYLKQKIIKEPLDLTNMIYK